MNLSSDSDLKSKTDLESDSIDDGWVSWVQYEGKVEFRVRKHYFNKSKYTSQITSYKYVCCKEGVVNKTKWIL